MGRLRMSECTLGSVKEGRRTTNPMMDSDVFVEAQVRPCVVGRAATKVVQVRIRLVYVKDRGTCRHPGNEALEGRRMDVHPRCDNDVRQL